MHMRSRYVSVVCIVALACLLRFWGLGDRKEYFFDEQFHTMTAYIYTSSGHIMPDDWYHPPLKHLLMRGSIAIFGDNPYGWRMRNAVIGSLTVILFIMLCRRLFDDARVAILAGTFLAVDPLHIFLSRTSSEEIQAIFFFIACLYFALGLIRGSTWQGVLAGLSFGLSLSSKWYYPMATGILILYVLFSEHRASRLNLLRIAYLFSVFVILPLSIYLLAYLPWFSRGYDLREFVQMQVVSFKAAGMISGVGWNPVLTRFGSAADWFIRPIITGARSNEVGTYERYSLFIGNFPVWLLIIPSFISMLMTQLRERNDRVVLILAIFAATYIPFLVISRPIFIYSAAPVVVFAYILVALLLLRLLDTLHFGQTCFRVLVVSVIAWGLYLYPLACNFRVPKTGYAPIISSGNVLDHF